MVRPRHNVGCSRCVEPRGCMLRAGLLQFSDTHPAGGAFSLPRTPLTPAPCLPPPLQPKEIMEIKDFLLTARRKDARCACPGVASCHFPTQAALCCSRCAAPQLASSASAAQRLHQRPSSVARGVDGVAVGSALCFRA